jgi:FkbM family methyltransferase
LALAPVSAAVPRDTSAAALECRARTAPAHEDFVLSRRQAFANDVHVVFDSWSAAAADGRAPPLRSILDIGANQGQTGRAFLRRFPLATVHSYELAEGTFGVLEGEHADESAANRARWHLHNLGMSSAPGTAPYSAGYGPGDEAATLGQEEGLGLGHGTAEATISTVAIELEAAGLGFVDLVKIDTEGWDREVIKGIDLARNAQRLGAVYFEYGSTWYDGRSGPSKASLEQVVADFALAGFECFLSGLTDLARITAPPDWRSPLKSTIMGYGPNVLCLNAALPASAAVLKAHSKALEQCPL